MGRVNKTIPNLQKVWDRFDKAYENMEAAFEMLESMSDVPNELRNEMARFDISEISSLKEHIEIMMEKKSKQILVSIRKFGGVVCLKVMKNI